MIAADSSNSITILSAVLPVVLTSLLGVSTLWFHEWRARRHTETRRRRALDEARSYIGFITEWFAAREAIPPDINGKLTHGNVTTALEGLLAEIDRSFGNGPPPETKNLWILFRRLLWLYPLRSGLGSIMRLAYYTVFGYICWATGVILLAKDLSWGDKIAGAVFFPVIGLAIMGPLWWSIGRLSPKAGFAIKRES